MSLPKEINYTEQMTSLPTNTQSKSIVISPANLTSLSTTTGGTAQFNLQNTGFIIPSSMYIRGKVNTTGTGNTAPMFQRGIPAYSLWSKSAVIVGSQVVEQINGYGRLATALVDLKLSPAGKSGMSPSFALTNEVDAQTLNTRLNGRFSDSNDADEYTFAAPLPNLLSLSEKLLPAEYMPSIRIELTLDNLSNIINQSAATADATSLTITNLEIVYTEVTFGGDFSPTLMSLADSNGDVLIKSQSYQTATQTLSAVAGTQTLTFNQRLSSVKSLLTYFDGVGANRVNGIYDAVDVTRGGATGTGGGSYQYQLGGVYYPQSPLDTARCRAGVFAELSNAFSPSHDYYSGQMAISPLEWSRDENSTSTQTSPAKFFIGVNTERLDTNGVMLSGVSTALVPISLNVRCDVAPQATLAHMVTLFDAIIQVNLMNRTCSVKI